MMQWWILDSYQITLKWLDNRFLLTNNNLVILCYDSDKLGRHLHFGRHFLGVVEVLAC